MTPQAPSLGLRLVPLVQVHSGKLVSTPTAVFLCVEQSFVHRFFFFLPPLDHGQ